jgi:hypothetical protein
MLPEQGVNPEDLPGILMEIISLKSTGVGTKLHRNPKKI